MKNLLKIDANKVSLPCGEASQNERVKVCQEKSKIVDEPCDDTIFTSSIQPAPQDDAEKNKRKKSKKSAERADYFNGCSDIRESSGMSNFALYLST